MAEKQLQALTKAHSLTLNERQSFSMEGVEDVESFTPAQIVLCTNMGKLVIKGKNLNITQLDTTGGHICADGTVDSLSYSPMKKKRSVVNALFK